MISLKIVSEFCSINGSRSSITLDLLPSNPQHHRNSKHLCLLSIGDMADMLHKAIRAMSIEEEEPLTLPDEPRFRVIADNELSILGRLLNPDCQSMEKMIDYMPTAWRVYGRVRGIALSRDRFQFVFQREEDLLTVLKDRPWSYNRWTMLLERWTPNPPENFLQTLEIWIRIRYIPLTHYTIDTMFALAKEIGKVEEIAYDPKVSQTKDYIRAKITFNVDNPAKAARLLNVKSGPPVSIGFEYEKIHKRCFHCLRLTHEKIRCPMLRKDLPREKPSNLGAQASPQMSQEPVAVPSRNLLEGPPGFPALFPELSLEEQKMAMLYISHSDEKERKARIQRVRQGIAEDATNSKVQLAKITSDLDKGKGHVFDYQASVATDLDWNQLRARDVSKSRALHLTLDDEVESSATYGETLSAPSQAGKDFQMGPSSGGRVLGASGSKKNQRKRPTSWRRKIGTRSTSALMQIPPSTSLQSMKRKSSPPPTSSDHKTLKITESTVASVLKPLQSS